MEPMKQDKPDSIDEYIAQYPKHIQKVLEQIHFTIKEAAPEAKETIKYAIPTFILKGNLVHFAAFSNHIGFYPTPSGMEAFDEELSRYKTGKGSVQFPLNDPMPFSLITKIVKYRVNEVLKKQS